jgi:secreted trypsin-like serine protease
VALALAGALLLAGLGDPGGAGSAEARPTPPAQSSIIGGGPADPADWPFAVTLFYQRRLDCGGSVIAATKVLTAAHCVLGLPISKLKVVANRPVLADTGVGERIAVVAKAVHPDYRDTLRHDLAVLTLATPTTAPAIALPTAEEAAAATALGSPLRVAGWGVKNPFRIGFPGFLKETTQRVLRGRRCERIFGFYFYGRSAICATGPLAPRWTRRLRDPIHTGPCSGDSGGPLVADTPAAPRLVGVVSLGGIVCGLRYEPNAYARVADGLEFIQGASAVSSGAGASSAGARASIVGGSAADFDNWRFTVAIFVRKLGHWCGGSVLSPTEILTAAHCAAGVAPSRFYVIANRFRLDDRGEGEKIPVIAKRIDPGYNWLRSRHDFAILTLGTPTTAPPVEMASAEEDALATRPGAPLRVAGWGSVDPFGATFPVRLREATVRARSGRWCRRLTFGDFLPAVNLCVAGARLPGRHGIRRSDCFGDSGGPLIADTTSGPRQVGVVSYGTDALCGKGPSVFSRVAGGLGFILGA